MKLQDLAKKPQLIKIEISDEDIVQEFGEGIEFWTWDRQPLSVFLKLASLEAKNTETIVTALRDMILDESGKPILVGDASLPTKVLMRCVTRLVEDLGK